MSLAAGTTLGPYEILAPLGRAGRAEYRDSLAQFLLCFAGALRKAQ